MTKKIFLILNVLCILLFCSSCLNTESSYSSKSVASTYTTTTQATTVSETTISETTTETTAQAITTAAARTAPITLATTIAPTTQAVTMATFPVTIPTENIIAINGSASGTVVNVVDGDTADITVNGIKYRVRFIGIDTPETVKPNTPVQFMGKEASDYTKSRLFNQNVTLEFDAQLYDPYNRLLAYVYVGGSFFNQELVQNGYASVATFPPNVKYEQLFIAAQKYAMDNNLGLYSQSQPASATAAVASEPKYISTSSKKIFHKLDCEWAQEINKTYAVYYSSREEAIAAGCRPCKVCNP